MIIDEPVITYQTSSKRILTESPENLPASTSIPENLSSSTSSQTQNNTKLYELAVTLLLAAIGVCSMAIYDHPSTECAETKHCGLWLTQFTSEQIAKIILFSAGIDFALINIYFGVNDEVISLADWREQQINDILNES